MPFAIRDLKTSVAAVISVAALGLLAGCGGSSDSDANVRLVNATSSFPSLDLYSDTTLLSSGTASYATGAYQSVDAATIAFNLQATGSATTAATLSEAVVKGDYYSIVAYTKAGVLTTAFITEDQATPTAGTASLRVMNTASTNAGAVDAYLVTTACSALSSSSDAAFATSVSGTSAFISATAASPGTAYHLCVTAAGDKTDLRLDIPSLTLTSQQIATVILTDTTGGVLLNGLVLNQQGTLATALNSSARMRLAVGTSASAAVSATANGTTLGSSLVAPAVGGYQLVAAGALTMNVTVGGTAVPLTGLTAPAGADLTLLVAGTAASTPTLISDDNTVSTSTSNPVKLHLVNGENGTVGAVTLTDDYVAVGNGAAFGVASTYQLVPASAALARVEATTGATQLCLSTGTTLASGHVYSVFLLGDIPTAATATACTIRLDH